MLAWFCHRHMDPLGSIYIDNELRGFTVINRGIEPVRARLPDDRELIGAMKQEAEVRGNPPVVATE